MNFIVRCGLAVCIGAAASGVVQAEPKTWFSLPAGNSYNLLADTRGAIAVRIPIIRSDVANDPAQFKATVFSATYRDARPPSVAQAFQPELSASNDKQGDALTVTLQDKTVAPGVYVVTVRLVPAKTSADYQDIVLTLQKPFPQIVPGAAITMDLVRTWWGPDEIVDGELRLAETSGLIGASALRLSEIHDGSVGKARPGSLEMATSVAVPARDSATVTIKPAGAFELGKTAGRIEIGGPELSANLSVPYEVHTKRTKAWLFVLTLAGALLGYATRIWAARVQKESAARTSASLAIEALHNACAQCADATYRQALETAITTLQTAVRQDAPDALLAAATTANTALATAKADLQTRQNAFLTKIAPLSAVLDQRWVVPTSTSPTLIDARSRLDDASALATAGNVVAAQTAFDDVRTGVLLNLMRTCDDSCVALAKFMSQVADAAPPLSDPALTQLQSAAAALAAANKAHAPTTVVDADGLKASLSAIHQTFFLARDLLEVARVAAGSFTTWAIARLEGHSEAAVTQLRAATEQRFRAFGEALSLLSRDDTLAARIVASSRADWRGFFATDTASPVSTAVDSLLSQSKWSAAVEQRRNDLQAAAAAAGQPARLPAPMNGQAPSPSGLGPLRSTVAEPAPGRAVFAAVRTVDIEGNAAERRALGALSESASVFQTWVVGLIFLFAVYALYGDAWVGTLSEMFAIFILAFGTDLTGDTVMAIAKRVKGPAAAA